MACSGVELAVARNSQRLLFARPIYAAQLYMAPLLGKNGKAKPLKNCNYFGS
jgi:hypothetical protein